MRLLALLLALVVPAVASAQYCRSGYTTVSRGTYSPVAESRVIVREAPVILKEDFLTQQFLNSQLLATAGLGTLGVGASQLQTGGLAAGFPGSGVPGNPIGGGQLAQNTQQGQQQPQGSQDQLYNLQVERQRLVDQQARQMASQTPQQTAAMEGSGIDQLKAEATAAAVAILREEIAALRSQLSQPGGGQLSAPKQMPDAQPQSRRPPARNDARKLAAK